MRIWAAACFVGLAALTGRGGDDGDSGSLVRYEIGAGELDFEFGEPRDSVIPVPDAMLVVEPDGQTTYEFADQPEIAFRLSDDDLSKLESDLDAIDFEEADGELSGENEEGLPTFSVTHDGTTVNLGDAFLAINYGEGPEVADRMFDLLDELDSLVHQAPGVEEATDEYLRGLEPS